MVTLLLLTTPSVFTWVLSSSLIFCLMVSTKRQRQSENDRGWSPPHSWQVSVGIWQFLAWNFQFIKIDEFYQIGHLLSPFVHTFCPRGLNWEKPSQRLLCTCCANMLKIFRVQPCYFMKLLHSPAPERDVCDRWLVPAFAWQCIIKRILWLVGVNHRAPDAP